MRVWEIVAIGCLVLALGYGFGVPLYWRLRLRYREWQIRRIVQRMADEDTDADRLRAVRTQRSGAVREMSDRAPLRVVRTGNSRLGSDA